MTVTLSSKRVQEPNFYDVNDKPYYFYLEKDVKKSIRKFKENLWNHKSKFEGVKCKTCLPLDYVDDELNKVFGKELTK